ANGSSCSDRLHPAVPHTAEEIAEQAAAAVATGRLSWSGDLVEYLGLRRTGPCPPATGGHSRPGGLAATWVGSLGFRAPSPSRMSCSDGALSGSMSHCIIVPVSNASCTDPTVRTVGS